jgi:hypothetical protein
VAFLITLILEEAPLRESPAEKPVDIGA